MQQAPIEISRTGDIAEAKLGGGQMAYMKLKREPGADRKGVVLRNVKYFGARTTMDSRCTALSSTVQTCKATSSPTPIGMRS